MLHRRGEHDHRAEVDAPPEEAQRRRSRPATTTLDRAAEASPPVVVVAERVRSAPRLAGVVGDIEPAAALASDGAAVIGEVVVEPQQQRIQSGVSKQFVAQGRPPFTSR